MAEAPAASPGTLEKARAAHLKEKELENKVQELSSKLALACSGKAVRFMDEAAPTDSVPPPSSTLDSDDDHAFAVWTRMPEPGISRCARCNGLVCGAHEDPASVHVRWQHAEDRKEELLTLGVKDCLDNRFLCAECAVFLEEEFDVVDDENFPPLSLERRIALGLE